MTTVTITCDRCCKQYGEEKTFRSYNIFTSGMHNELNLNHTDTHFCHDCLRVLVGRIQEWKRRAE